ncbi:MULTISPECIES: acylphosphatase [Lactobacillus]|uniref:acylphosphatase n=1 Tax=Lactobacillus xujianguonis TaxID=2495899 RepID=A0A437ST11_9LACO|nr:MULTISPECIES: acylphosphatase [Lactobacillus]RVU70081.1 acylphosphatase [Lactobacillus xujianguonis]RVU77790.1 acylphosphatase [Lactobacillus xujianguonis]
METWKLIAHGTVQGVGFRWSVQNLAQALGINGTVRNNPDMTVTIMLQSSLDEVNHFIAELPKNVSPFAKITQISKEKLTGVEKMHGFHVLY